MKRLSRLALVCCAAWGFAPAANALSIPFILNGNAGPGLLGGNENPVIVGGGSGGLVGGGIVYDTDTNVLSIEIAWGSANGFTDLTGAATLGHIHGATTSSAPTGYSQNASPLIDLNTLSGWDSSASAGGFDNDVVLSEAQEAFLLANRLYINVHTSANPGGEIRGHLIAVPEPSTLVLTALGLALLGARRRTNA